MSEQPKVYLARAGRVGEDEEYALEHGLAVIGFEEVPALEQDAAYEHVLEIVRKVMPNASPRAAGNYAGQLWAFASMQLNDIVVLPRKETAQIALGRVAGPYRYERVNGVLRHTRQVRWIRPDVARTVFQQDLLYSFGAFMTVCTISRNDAVRRITAVLEGGTDSGAGVISDKPLGNGTPMSDESAGEVRDLSQVLRDQIVARIQSNFAGHDLTWLVDAVLRADGWITRVSPPGADGGVDILAGRGTLGLDEPRLVVQVKSQLTACDVTVYRSLQGTMQSFKASQGLLVCWGGFNRAVQLEARQSYFSVRLWESEDLLQAIFRTYPKLSEDVQATLPLKQVWMLVEPSGSGEAAE